MPIKNYTTTVTADKSILQIQNALVEHGASAFMFEYEDGRISSLKFALDYKGQRLGFSLPVNWKKYHTVLEKQLLKPRSRKKISEERAYMVAWANLRDWVLAQMALYETELVELPQVFLPFVTVNAKGDTLYDKFAENKFLLSSGE